jgi:hypothetical protein
MPDHLQQIAATTSETEQMSAQWVAPQNFLHLQRQAGKALPHISVPGRQPYPYPEWNWDHRRRSAFTNNETIVPAIVASAVPESRIRVPDANSISIDPGAAGDGTASPRSMTATAAKPGAPPFSAQSSWRQRNSWAG